MAQRVRIGFRRSGLLSGAYQFSLCLGADLPDDLITLILGREAAFIFGGLALLQFLLDYYGFVVAAIGNRTDHRARGAFVRFIN